MIHYQIFNSIKQAELTDIAKEAQKRQAEALKESSDEINKNVEAMQKRLDLQAVLQ